MEPSPSEYASGGADGFRSRSADKSQEITTSELTERIQSENATALPEDWSTVGGLLKALTE